MMAIAGPCIHGNRDDEDCIPCELGYVVRPPPGYRVLRAELLRERYVICGQDTKLAPYCIECDMSGRSYTHRAVLLPSEGEAKR